MTCTAYVNSVPEHVPVTINNTTVNVAVDDAAVEWVVDTFELADSAGDLGLVFFLSKRAVDPNQIQVFLDTVPQVPGASESFVAAADRVTMNVAIESGAKLMVRYLAYTETDTWSTEVFSIADSADAEGLVFTLGAAPLDDTTHLHVLKNGTLLVLTTNYTLDGVTLTLLAALVAGDQLIVTYAHA